VWDLIAGLGGTLWERVGAKMTCEPVSRSDLPDRANRCTRIGGGVPPANPGPMSAPIALGAGARIP
jgi:hypothetical protein